MPTILRSDALRFFFYSLENAEPPQSMSKAGTLPPSLGSNLMELARSRGFRASELTRLRATIIEHRHEFVEAWYAHFGKSA
jgi:hypothetical protein